MPYRVRDLLEHWRAQGAITPAQFDAGRRFLRLYDATIRGGATTDPARVRVDGGVRFACEAESIAVARSELDDIARVVGRFDFALMCRIIGTGKDLRADTPDEGERKYLARRVRDALAVMANRDRIVAPAA